MLVFAIWNRALTLLSCAVLDVAQAGSHKVIPFRHLVQADVTRQNLIRYLAGVVIGMEVGLGTARLVLFRLFAPEMHDLDQERAMRMVVKRHPPGDVSGRDS